MTRVYRRGYGARVDLTSEIQSSSGLARIAPGLQGWCHVVVTGTVEGYRVRLEVGAVEAQGEQVGRFECYCLEVRTLGSLEGSSRSAWGPAVSTEALRRIPVAAIMADQAWQWVEFDGLGRPSGEDPRRLAAGDYELMRAQGPTERTLRTLAVVYRFALVIGSRPTVAVQEAFGVPKPTASRWVAQARERGHLGPSEGPGKAAG